MPRKTDSNNPGDWLAIAESELEALQVLAELRKLSPKPGADFNEVVVPPVTPDVFVEPDDAGQYRVRLEEGQTPSLFISAYYRKLFQNADTSPETREYIKRKINSAQWLIDSIEQRRSTLLTMSLKSEENVARAIYSASSWRLAGRTTA